MPQRLCHYFLAYELHLMVKANPLHYLLTKPASSGCLARWLLQLSAFDITCIMPKAIKSQVVVDFMTQFSNNGGTSSALEDAAEPLEVISIETTTDTLGLPRAPSEEPLTRISQVQLLLQDPLRRVPGDSMLRSRN